MRRAVSSRAGLIIVLALAACSAVLFWRVSSLSNVAVEYGHVSASRDVADEWFAVYQQSRVISGGQQDWANDDIVEHRFARYALTSGRDETIDTVVSDNQLGFGQPWMRPNGDRELLFYRRRDAAGDIVRIDVKNLPAADQSGDWAYAHPSPDGQSAALLPSANNAMIQLRLADGSVKMISTAGRVDSGYLAPAAWSADGTKLYLRATFEGGGYVSGLWSIDVATGELAEIPAVRKLGLMHYEIYPESAVVVGSVFRCDAMDDCGRGPSKLYRVNLTTGASEVIASNSDFAFLEPKLSPDGKRVVYRLGNGQDDTADVWLQEIGANAPTTSLISGRALAWTPDGQALVLDRDNEMQIYKFDDKSITKIAERRGRYGDPDYQGLEFVGLVRQKN